MSSDSYLCSLPLQLLLHHALLLFPFLNDVPFFLCCCFCVILGFRLLGCAKKGGCCQVGVAHTYTYTWWINVEITVESSACRPAGGATVHAINKWAYGLKCCNLVCIFYAKRRPINNNTHTHVHAQRQTGIRVYVCIIYSMKSWTWMCP